MPQVFRRRAEFVVAESIPAGGTVSTRNGIIPIQQGDMMVHTGGEAQHYSAADFASQFEPVAYDDAPEHLREVVDPERAQADREKAEKAEEREAAKETRAAAEKTPKARATSKRSSKAKTTKLQPDRNLQQEAEQRRAQEEEQRTAQARQERDEHANASPAAAALQDQGDFGPQPTPEAQRTWNE